ncbi:MAG: tail fiber domain-containing protein [Flavobacteriales bacterium]|nr:tail fiber domain-containing protein [Flavobacteriales bacterium]
MKYEVFTNSLKIRFIVSKKIKKIIIGCLISLPMLSNAQFNTLGTIGRTDVFPSTIAGIGIGNFPTVPSLQARLHVNNFLLGAPNGPLNGFLFRTDGSNTVANSWSIYTGANNNNLTEKFRLFVPTNSVNTVLQATQGGSRFTFNTGGAFSRMHITQDILNRARVGIGELNNPLTYLHIGLDAFPGSGFRPWMNKGVLMYGSPTGEIPTMGTDNMYIGLREVAPDNTESVINWGNNPVQTNIPDRLVFRFTAAQNIGIPASGLLGVETARMISDGTIIGTVGTRFGIGGDANFANPYSNGVDPGNTVEINSPAVTPGPLNTGLRFTDLNSSVTPIANPGSGILSVNAIGDVIYVESTPGGGGLGTCISPTTFGGSGGAIHLSNTDNFHFLGNNSGSLTVDNVMIGATSCITPSAKLHVLQNANAPSSIGILAENNDVSSTTNPTVGIKSILPTDPTCSGIAAWLEAPSANMAVCQPYALFVPHNGGRISINYPYNDPAAIPWMLALNGAANSPVGWFNLSDQAFKTKLDTISNPLEKIKNINGVYFEFDTLNYPNYHFPSGKQIGFIAQNVDTILPEAVSDNGGPLSMDYAKITPLLLEAVKSLTKKVETLETQLNQCCQNNNYQNNGVNNNHPQNNELGNTIKVELSHGDAIVLE